MSLILLGISVSIHRVFKVYPMGFYRGAAGLNGTGFVLMIVIFLELFGVSLGQLLAAVSPSIQVG
jgi:ATP-binding cassette subfamily G (WHITE) protein 2 (SNQ2)